MRNLWLNDKLKDISYSSAFKATQHTAQWSYGSFFIQNELVVEIYYKSPVRGKVFCMKFSQNTN